MILGGNHNERKTHFDWSLFISYPFPWRVCQGIEMIRFVLVLYSISVSRAALTDLMDLAVPFPAEKSVGQMVMPIALGLLRRCFLGGFATKQSWWVWNQPYKQKAQGLFFSPNFSGIFTASNVPVSSSHTYHDESTDVCGPVCLKVAGGLRFHGL